MNCTKLQAKLAHLKNLSRDVSLDVSLDVSRNVAKRLPIFLLYIGMITCIMPASGQIGPIKKEGGIYYEYIEPVASIYKQYSHLRFRAACAIRPGEQSRHKQCNKKV